MMKNLLVLALVLGMATLASAGFSLVADGANATVTTTDDAPYAFWIVVDNSLLPVEYTFTSDGNPNGDSVMTAYGDFGGTDWTYFSIRSLAPANPLIAGDHLLISASLKAGQFFGTQDMGLGRIDMVSEDESTVLGSLYVMTPEPMTMGLLALGGLFLRRRK